MKTPAKNPCMQHSNTVTVTLTQVKQLCNIFSFTKQLLLDGRYFWKRCGIHK